MKHKKFTIITVSVILLTLTLFVRSVYATVGDEYLCNFHTTGDVQVANDANDLIAQTFTTTSAVTVGAVKLNMYQDPAAPLPTTLNIHITDTLVGAPDLNSILGTESFEKITLPIFDVPANNGMSCDPNDRPSQVIEFVPPVALAATTQYAIALEWGGAGDTTTSLFLVPYMWTGGDTYPAGNAFDCNVPTSCSKLTPATWDFPNGHITDYPFTIYDNVEQVIRTGDAESWSVNFLNSIGLNTVWGKILAGSAVGLAIMLFVVLRGGPPMIALSLGGIFSTVLVGGLLIPQSVFLTLVVLVGIGIMFSMFYGRNRSSTE